MTEIRNPHVQAYLESFGLNPLRISVTGITPEGYFEFRFDDEGNWTPNESGDRRLAFPVKWPADFDYDKFQEARQKDGLN